MHGFKVFAKTVIKTYVGGVYALPAAYVMYDEKFGGRYTNIRNAFNMKNKKLLFFPFYHERATQEAEVKSLMRSDKGSVLVHGKPTTGKSTLVKHACMDIGEGVCRVRPLQDDAFSERFQTKLNFEFQDHFTWDNYMKHIRFPLDIFITPHCDEIDTFERSLKHLINFVSENPREDGNPWVLVIDEADRLSPFEFEMMRQTGDILGQKGVLTVVFVSSQAGFIRTFYERCGQDETKLLRLNGLSAEESRSFLQSEDCRKFVNYFRKTRNKPPLNDSDIDRCLEICGGSPQWLLQAAMNSPQDWEDSIVKRTEKLLAKSSPKLEPAMRLLCDENETQAVAFDQFVDTVGSHNKALSLLEEPHGTSQDCGPFYYDVIQDSVSFCFPYHRRFAANRLNVSKS